VSVPGSGGHEDAVMKCCRDKAGSFWGEYTWFPWAHDCQNLAGDCLTENGLKNPGGPGGRLGCRGNCPPPQPPPPCHGWGCVDNR
jgi:hypothetical protein